MELEWNGHVFMHTDHHLDSAFNFNYIVVKFE